MPISFPLLKTGAVAQYPLATTEQFSTQIVRFLDGGEQRFADFGAPLRRWVIRLSLLDEAEMHLLQEFFREQMGESGEFSFTDPASGTVYASCSFEGGLLREQFDGEMSGQTELVVRENRS